MRVTIKIDPNECISAANCVGISPDFFQIGDQPHVELLDGKGNVQGVQYSLDATAAQVELFEEAVESCPTRAIRLTKG